VRKLLSSEHFSVDGTLIEAWASVKSFVPKYGRDPPPGKDGGRNAERDFRGEKRTNDTHCSTTDPDARLFRKGLSKEAKLCHMGHVMVENRNNLIVDARLTEANGNAERARHDRGQCQAGFGRREAMVSGIVRPPAIDLANRDLIEAHLHAVWLAESAQELQPDIPHVLDLSDAALPVQNDIANAFADPALTGRGATSIRRILDGVKGELTVEAAPWVEDRNAFADATAAAAAKRFSEAFGRWRQLYQSAREQLIEANRRSEMHGLSAFERRGAKAQQAQANEQLALLEKGAATGGADFYTYRYLATEGFLPGYNFPRLPLYAYVPATSAGSKGGYLQRARFIAISEFGPRSLIYHEGRAYRVYKAKLPPGIRTEDGGRLPTPTIYVCDECGAAHNNDEPERCHACNAPIGGVHPIRNVLRIDNVETRPAERRVRRRGSWRYPVGLGDSKKRRSRWRMASWGCDPPARGETGAHAFATTSPIASPATRLRTGVKALELEAEHIEQTLLEFGIPPRRVAAGVAGKRDRRQHPDPVFNFSGEPSATGLPSHWLPQH
jgi:hypothetical protein